MFEGSHWQIQVPGIAIKVGQARTGQIVWNGICATA